MRRTVWMFSVACVVAAVGGMVFGQVAGRDVRSVPARFTDPERRAKLSAAFGDIDQDGDVDVVVTNNNGPARLLLNEAGAKNHWLAVRLEGVASNREGIGARIAVLRTGEKPLWRRAHRDGSYLSSSDVVTYFGLGQKTEMEGVGVVWPNGRRELFRSLKADSRVTLREGTGEEWSE